MVMRSPFGASPESSCLKRRIGLVERARRQRGRQVVIVVAGGRERQCGSLRRGAIGDGQGGQGQKRPQQERRVGSMSLLRGAFARPWRSVAFGHASDTSIRAFFIPEGSRPPGAAQADFPRTLAVRGRTGA